MSAATTPTPSSPTKPISQNLGPGSLKLGSAGSEREFAASTTKTELKPEYKTEDPVPLLSGDSYVPEGTWAGSIEGEFYQEFSMESLVAWTYENAGATLPFVFRPNNKGALAFKGKCVISPVSVGGDAGKANTASFAFTLVGRPEHYDATKNV
jgi:hypothetical protein